LQFGAGETSLEFAFIDLAFARLSGVLPQMKTEHDAKEPPRVVHEEAAQGSPELENVSNLRSFGNRLARHEGNDKRPQCSMDEKEGGQQKEVQQAPPFPVSERNRNTIENPDERQRNETFE